MKVLITENKLDNVALNWLDNNYSNLTTYETEEHPGYIFYKKGDDVIFDYSVSSGRVFVNYDKIWKFLKNFFDMDDYKIMTLLKHWVEKSYNLSVLSAEPNHNPLI